MISYVLITKDKLSYSNPCLQGIWNLPPHEHEIIAYCPASSIQDHLDELTISTMGITVIEDTKKAGSPSAFNDALNYVQGKYISYLLNDIIYPSNLLDVVDYLNDGDGKNKKFKLVNLFWDAGPGLIINHHADESVNGKLWEHDIRSTPVPKEYGSYPIIGIPFVELDTIDKYLDGHIFHPAFKNHCPDHWLGFYLSRNEVYNPYSWVCPGVRYSLSGYQRVSSSHTDNEDNATLRTLADKWNAHYLGGCIGEFKYTVEL